MATHAITTRDPKVESAREVACDVLGVRRDVLDHQDGEHGLLLALAARLVLQALDNDLTRLEPALVTIGETLRRDYPHLGR